MTLPEDVRVELESILRGQFVDKGVNKSGVEAWGIPETMEKIAVLLTSTKAEGYKEGLSEWKKGLPGNVVDDIVMAAGYKQGYAEGVKAMREAVLSKVDNPERAIGQIVHLAADQLLNPEREKSPWAGCVW